MPTRRTAPSRRPWVLGSIATVAAAAVAAALLVPDDDAPTAVAVTTTTSSPVPTTTWPSTGPERPNVVVFMLDDLSYELVQYMPAVRDMLAEGTEFTNYFVSTSRCCPSRATFLTGQYPHNNGVTTNSWDKQHGGFGGYHPNIGQDLGPVLQQAGYRTGFVGKYLNEYTPQGPTQQGRDPEPPYPKGFVPAGWNEWHVGGSIYSNFAYSLTEAVDPDKPAGADAPPGFRGPVTRYPGHAEEDYLTTVLGDRALEFLDTAVEPATLPDTTSVDPFALMITPYATHQGRGDPEGKHISFPAAPADRPQTCPAKKCTPHRSWDEPEYLAGDCGDHTEPAPSGGGCEDVVFPDPLWAGTYLGDTDRDPSTPEVPHVDPPAWLADDTGLTKRQLANARAWHLQRIQMAQSVSDVIDRVRDRLEQLGLDDNTYVMFTSDNGFYLGQHGLLLGKNSAYDHDVRVPLIVVPPGDPAPRTVSGVIVQNTDLAPTIAALATAEMPAADGMDLTAFVRMPGQPAPEPERPATWRDAALLTYVRDESQGDPDHSADANSIPSFAAVRTADYLYVDYDPADGVPPTDHRGGELYVLASDPQQMTNRFDELVREDPGTLGALDALVDLYQHCNADPSSSAPPCQEVALAAPAVALDD